MIVAWFGSRVSTKKRASSAQNPGSALLCTLAIRYLHCRASVPSVPALAGRDHGVDFDQYLVAGLYDLTHASHQLAGDCHCSSELWQREHIQSTARIVRSARLPATRQNR
jgi:hypothetical protein